MAILALMLQQHSTPESIWLNCRLAGAADAGLQAVQIRGGRITGIIPMQQHDRALTSERLHDARGAWLTPGFVDCHTHLIWAGSRAAEIEQRFRGVPYAEIAKQGGGILSTVRASRAASEEQLFEQALPRLN